MKDKLLLFAAIGMVAMLVAACAQFETPGPTPTVSVSSLASLVTALEDQGMTVTTGGQVTQPFLSVPGQILTVGGQEIQVYPYPDEAAATSDAQKISADGTSADGTQLSWTGTPHFYQAGPVIVLYVGDDAGTTFVLLKAMGPQFAGG